MYPNQTCPLDGCTHLDTLASLLTCPVLSGQVDNSISVQYEDVFSPDLEKQRAAAEVYDRLLQISCLNWSHALIFKLMISFKQH